MPGLAVGERPAERLRIDLLVATATTSESKSLQATADFTLGRISPETEDNCFEMNSAVGPVPIQAETSRDCVSPL
jgi:hypothetical protein